MEKKVNNQGIVWVPYIFVNVATSINGEVVWYKNKWKNLLLKLKFLFVKPKYFKNKIQYSKKTIDPNFYGKIELKGNGKTYES